MKYILRDFLSGAIFAHIVFLVGYLLVTGLIVMVDTEVSLDAIFHVGKVMYYAVMGVSLASWIVREAEDYLM